MKMTSPSYLKHHFLLAMPHMADENFAHTLIYLCEHNADGAMGLIINQPSELNLAEVISQLAPEQQALPAALFTQSVFSGGPVETERGFVLHDDPRPWDATADLGELRLTTSRDILLAMAEGDGPEHTLIALGYAGWDAGQLDQELVDNVWLSCPADQHILFDLPPAQRLQAAARSLGIDLGQLSSQSGHA
ncbi:MAG: YqgE/AlgH family protein [Pseudomonadaceae bacterium]|nr:MAG: YqgE/AlgH family protein [Pseudomonadaceae bacterium]